MKIGIGWAILAVLIAIGGTKLFWVDTMSISPIIGIEHGSTIIPVVKEIKEKEYIEVIQYKTRIEHIVDYLPAPDIGAEGERIYNSFLVKDKFFEDGTPIPDSQRGRYTFVSTLIGGMLDFGPWDIPTSVYIHKKQNGKHPVTLSTKLPKAVVNFADPTVIEDPEDVSVWSYGVTAGWIGSPTIGVKGSLYSFDAYGKIVIESQNNSTNIVPGIEIGWTWR
jgi:hypothetical protein